MELIEGGELYQHFSVKKPMKAVDARIYVAMIALGLDALHSKGIVYHDLNLTLALTLALTLTLTLTLKESYITI